MAEKDTRDVRGQAGVLIRVGTWRRDAGVRQERRGRAEVGRGLRKNGGKVWDTPAGRKLKESTGGLGVACGPGPPLTSPA